MAIPRALRTGLAALILASVTLTGCVVAPAPGYYGDGAVVAVAPPAPQVEVIGVAPGPGYVWGAGYWDWVGGRHVWVGGHWMAGRPGYHWVPHRWVGYRGGYRMARGHWER